MRVLVLGSMPEGATPDSHIAAGPWCFAGREFLFPGWDGTPLSGGAAFPLPPDPFADAAAIEAAARSANAEALRLTRVVGESLQRAQGKELSERFWQLALGPFFLLTAHMLIERQRRALDLVKLYGGERLRVELLPGDLPFCFGSSLDFILHGVLDADFNHFLYSRILEKVAPESWRMVHLPPKSLRGGPGARRGPRERMAGLLRDLPFPRFKGFALWQSLLLSVAVLGNKRGKADAGTDFSLYCGEPPEWRFDAERIMRDCLPLALRQAVLPCGSARPERPGALRGMTAAFSQDDLYRLRLAGLREKGCRLFCVQHGANYGNLRSLGIIPFEYGQHAFFSWGWERHQGQPVNANALAHPLPTRVAGRHRETEASLILVGTEMSAFSYRLKSRPQAGALPAYRMAKTSFLAAVSRGLRGKDARILYRPYASVAGGLEDGAYVLRHAPQAALCEGDLTRHMLGCRLLVLDHYGTTLHMALAADVPCIAFWNREHWAMEDESESALDALREAGMLHDDARSAAEAVLARWDDLAVWWRGQKRRKARALWLGRYARIGGASGKAWSAWELTRHWFTALRNC